MRAAGRFTAVEMHALGVTPAELRKGGYPLKQLKEGVGLGVADLKEAGYSADELEDVGFSAKALRECFSVEECLSDPKIGYECKEFREAGFSAADLKRYRGLSARELCFAARCRTGSSALCASLK